MRIVESLNVTFDERFSEPKSSSSVEDDGIDEHVVQDLSRSPSSKANVSEPGNHKSVKEARGHPIEQVIEEEETTNWNVYSLRHVPIRKSFHKLCLVEDPLWEKINSELVKPSRDFHMDEYCLNMFIEDLAKVFLQDNNEE
ncbi:hypothetical protein Tco_0233202 [Tanacetum coccineum]